MTADTPSLPRVIVGVDGSPQAEAALRWAARIAKAEGASIQVVCAWEYATGYGWATVPMGYSLEDDMKELAQTSINAVFGDTPPVDLSVSVVEANPAQALIAAGKNALMIVVGSRGRGGFAGLLLGSVSQKVAEHASCSVLVIHGHSDAADRD
jgi:nucleotide-binding universal stress UspA family protein